MSNLDAFLKMTRACEGTDGPNGYRTLFGGKLFDSFDDHPNVRTPFRQTDGSTNYSTAAGAYQENYPTFLRLSAKLGTTDFSPATQDLHAGELIAERGAMADVKEGRLQEAIDKTSGIWASLPASHYPQPKRTYLFATEAYAEAGGTFA